MRVIEDLPSQKGERALHRACADDIIGASYRLLVDRSGLLPLPELGRGRRVGWIHETVGMHHRGRASHDRDNDVRSALRVGV